MFDFDKELDRSSSYSLKYDARQAYFGRADVLPMWVADMDFAAPEAVTKALVERASHPIYGYTLYPDSVYQSLIDWCQRRYQWSIEQQNILMCPGVVPSLHAAIEALTEIGDKVVVQPPVYFPFFSAVTETGRELVLNPLINESGEYRMDLAHLEQCAKAGAKMLLLCSPHNPVGRVWQEQELRDLLEITEKYQMVVVSDEIHADLIYPGQRHIPLASLSDSENVVTALAPSKTFNIPGLGLSSLVVATKKQKHAINKVFESWHISASNPFSITAYQAAYNHGEAWLDALMPYLQNTVDWAYDFIKSQLTMIDITKPEGTYLLWLDCRAMEMDNQQLRQFFIEQAGVGMNPGFVFGEVGGGFMRMNIGTPQAKVRSALNLIADAMKSIE